jgi:hypothetical protein
MRFGELGNWERGWGESEGGKWKPTGKYKVQRQEVGADWYDDHGKGERQ